jgi:hypothetical protein
MRVTSHLEETPSIAVKVEGTVTTTGIEETFDRESFPPDDLLLTSSNTKNTKLLMFE